MEDVEIKWPSLWTMSKEISSTIHKMEKNSNYKHTANVPNPNASPEPRRFPSVNTYWADEILQGSVNWKLYETEWEG